MTRTVTVSEQILKEYASKTSLNAKQIKTLIEDVLHNPAFDEADVDTDMLRHFSAAIHNDDLEIISVHQEGDGDQKPELFKRPADKVCVNCYQTFCWLDVCTLASSPFCQLQDTSSHREVSLVFFSLSRFEPISFTPDSCMQSTPMVYERAASLLPTLFVCPVENVLCRVPLVPCYLNGNLHHTIPYSLRYHVPAGAAADSRQDSGTGSRLF